MCVFKREIHKKKGNKNTVNQINHFVSKARIYTHKWKLNLKKKNVCAGQYAGGV